jgi:hypothetical protein
MAYRGAIIMVDGKTDFSRRAVDHAGAHSARARHRKQIETSFPDPSNDNVDDLTPFVNLILAVAECRAASTPASDPPAPKSSLAKPSGQPRTSEP